MGSFSSSLCKTTGESGRRNGAGPKDLVSDAAQAGESAKPSGQPLRITGRMLQGLEVDVAAYTSDTVRTLQMKFAEQMEGKHWSQIFVSFNNVVLQERATLETCGAVDGHAVVFIVVGSPLPDWAAELGFERSHCDWLRDHYRRHELALPQEFSDDNVVWEKLRQEYESRDQQMQKYKGWGHRLWLQQGGCPTGQVRAAAGGKVQFVVKGHIWNNKRDTCIQQCGLALGADCVKELYNGVPSSARRIEKTVTVTAPQEPGAYMLYRFGDLQYSFRDALRNFQHKPFGAVAVYPQSFVGWLVVE